jgi:CRISPR-associated protein Csm5
MSKQRYKLIIEPLTGVHIGSGNELTPLDYTVIESVKFKSGTHRPLYFKFSSEKILKRLMQTSSESDLREFKAVSDSGDMRQLHTFFQHHFDLKNDMDYPCEVTNEFLERYTYNKNKDPVDNAGVVQQMYRPKGKKAPVIPGSSLKGAIRTALLDYYLNPVHESPELNSKRNLEAYLLRCEDTHGRPDAKKDPLRCLGIADCTVPAQNTQLVGCLKNIFWNSGKEDFTELSKLQITAEIIRGTYIGGKPRAETELQIDMALQNPALDQITKRITTNDIIKSCNYFYWDIFTDEYNKFYKDAVDREKYIKQLFSDLKAVTAEKDKNRFILRLGRWSQVEYMTFAYGLSKPQSRLGKYGNTRTVFDYNGEYVPMGWCLCSLEKI